MLKIKLSVDWVNFGYRDIEPKKYDGTVIAENEDRAIEVLLEEISPDGEYDWNGATTHEITKTEETEEKVLEWEQNEEFEAIYVNEDECNED